jgi:hypothetical protein
MKRAVKKKEHENLSKENIKRVLSFLTPRDGSKPITKKEACEMLNISYNTTRLDKILEEFQEREEYVAKRKASNRGRPATNAEIADAVTSYLQGSSISVISKSLYRSPAFVKSILDKVGVPERPANKEEKLGYDYIPEECTSETFKKGEIVWSARYHSVARVEEELSSQHQSSSKGLGNTDYEKKYGAKCYAVYIMKAMDIDTSESLFPRVESGGFNAYALAYDLGKLEHLQQYGVDLTRL